jgi:hypothetical protein
MFHGTKMLGAFFNADHTGTTGTIATAKKNGGVVIFAHIDQGIIIFNFEDKIIG